MYSNLANIAKQHNITVRKLAREIDYRYESVRSLWNNTAKHYPGELLYRICMYFNIGINELLLLHDPCKKDIRS